MIYVLYLIHILISIFLILVVLLQQGKGADLSVFGGGGTQVAFGARGAATVLHKLTVVCFVLFLVTTLTLGILSARSNPSVMQGVVAEESTDEGGDELSGPAGGTLEDLEQADGETPDSDGADSDAAAADAATNDTDAVEGDAAESAEPTDDGTP